MVEYALTTLRAQCSGQGGHPTHVDETLQIETYSYFCEAHIMNRLRMVASSKAA